ncbi:MAG: DNA cytosine methyltransferase [Candidatus Nanohaloarchaea archaeon]
MSDDSLTVADFFCGAGGLSEGFRQKGFEIRYATDYWEPAIETHRKNHPEAEHELLDITEMGADEIDDHVPDVDIIVGGPPCQNFSRSNRAGKADKTEGLHLIEHFLRIVAWKMEHGDLKYWAMENVPPTANHLKDKYTWEELQLPGEGSDLIIEKKPVHHAVDYGAPQSRRRMIAGNYPELKKRKDEDEWKTVQEVFDCLGDPQKPEDAPDTIKDPNYDLKVPKAELTDHFYDTRVEEYRWKRAKRLKEDHGFMGKMSFPEDTDAPSRTVMATRSASTREAMIFGGEKDEDGNYKNFRLPTVREIACFSSFPLTYQFEASTESKKFRLVGNAVPVKLSSAIAEAIAEEEGMETPDEFRELPDAELENDLTGKERDFREPRKRREDSKFSRHVPYLKTKAFRPSLTNEGSDFDDGEVKWSAILHKGVGKNAVEDQESLDTIAAVIRRGESGQMKLDSLEDSHDIEGRFEEFRQRLRDEFETRLPDAKEFQRIYTRRSDADYLGPHEALEELREIIDEHFPEDEFEEVYLDNSDRELEVPDDDVPVRIAVGFYGCRFIADEVNGKKQEKPVATDKN